MDGYSGKRAIDGHPSSRKGKSGIVLRERLNKRDRNAPVCSRITARIDSMKGTRTGSLDIAKANGKEIIEASSRPSYFTARKSSTENDKKLLLQLETDSSEASSDHDDAEISELNLHLGSENISQGEIKAESSSFASSMRTQRGYRQRFGLDNQETHVGSSSRSRCGNTGRHGVRNMRCNSISDVVSYGFSSELSLSRRKDSLVEMRKSDRGKKIMKKSIAEERACSFNRGISINDARQERNSSSNRDYGVASVRSRRSVDSYSRTRLSNQGTTRNSLSSSVIPERPQAEISTHLDSPLSMEASPVFSEVGVLGSLMTRDSFRLYNVDGIAEVLLALERIEQDAEIYYEQLSLETSLFLNALNLYDQHREMRLDIDNMSYEELLALEERMGTVSTALTEEALSKCLKTSIFQGTPSDKLLSIGSCEDKNDVKCSICQEEYIEGDEVGRLCCGHRYHVGCIHQWLRLKNWCPICKASAEPSSL